MTTPPATLDEFLEYIDKTDLVTGTSKEDELNDILVAATEAAEGWRNVGPIVTETFTQRIGTDDCGRLVLPKTPVQSVASATRVTDGLEYLAADFDVDNATGIVTLADGSGLDAGDYTVIYDAGRGAVGDVPVSLKLAVLIIAGHLYQTQQGPTTNRFIGDANAEDTFRPSAGYLIPNRAAHLLQPEQSVAVA